MASLKRRFVNGSAETPAFHFHVKVVNDFIDSNSQPCTHAWKMLSQNEEVQMQCELLWFLEIVQSHLLTGGKAGSASEHKDAQNEDDPFAESEIH